MQISAFIFAIFFTSFGIYLYKTDDGKPLQLQLTLLKGNEEYSAGSHIVDFGIHNDRYEAQLLDLAKFIRGEMKNPYTYEHDFLTQQVVMAASGYKKWEG